MGKFVLFGLVVFVVVLGIRVVMEIRNPTPPPIQQTAIAVQTEATQAVVDATHSAEEQLVMATTAALQTETARIKAGPPPSPIYIVVPATPKSTILIAPTP